MSEIDLSDPFMGKELATSQVSNSMDEDLTVPQLLMNRGSYDSNPSSKNIYHAFQSKFRRSENPHTLYKPQSSNILKNTSFFEHKSSRVGDSFDKGYKQATTIGQDEQFECRCSGNGKVMKENCNFCRGKGVIKGGNNLIKFFDFVIAFKMGKRQSYSKKKLNSFKKDNSINNFCTDFYNENKDNQSNYSVRSSNNHSKQTNTKKFAYSQIFNELTSSLTIHHNFQCDRCRCSPIVGYRYHCNYCQDYDQCDSCYQSSPHHHELEKIDKCERSRQLENMLKNNRNSLKQNSSLRPPPSIHRPFQSFGVPAKSSMT